HCCPAAGWMDCRRRAAPHARAPGHAARAAGARAGAQGVGSQDPLFGHARARGAYADDRGAGEDRTAAHHVPGRAPAPLHRLHPPRRRPPDAPGQRRPGPGPDRGRETGAGSAALRPAAGRGRRGRSDGAARPPARTGLPGGGGCGCSGRAAGRSGADPPNPAQLAGQCDQVHRARGGVARGPAAVARGGAGGGRRYRARVERGAAVPPVPPVRAGRRRPHRFALWRQRPGPGDLPGAGRGNGRPHPGGIRARPGRPVPGGAAPAGGPAAGACPRAGSWGARGGSTGVAGGRRPDRGRGGGRPAGGAGVCAHAGRPWAGGAGRAAAARVRPRAAGSGSSRHRRPGTGAPAARAGLEAAHRCPHCPRRFRRRAAGAPGRFRCLPAQTDQRRGPGGDAGRLARAQHGVERRGRLVALGRGRPGNVGSILKWVLAALVAVSTAGAAHGAGELPRPRQVSVADGLPSNSVSDMAEDRDGFLWLSTFDGLARYDGTGFRVWRIEDGLPDVHLWSLDIDSRGVIWLGTELAGPVAYDPRAGAFTDASALGLPELASEQVWTVAVDADDGVWFGTASSGLLRRSGDGRIEHFLPDDNDPRSLPSAAVNVVEVAPDGSVWVGTREGVARWTGRDFERLPDGALPDERVNTLVFEPDGSLWIGTAGGVAHRRPDGTMSAHAWAAQGETRVIDVLARDSRGDYWLDIPAGLGFAPDTTGAVSVVPLYSESSRGEVRPYWAGAHEDREGGLWLRSSSHALWYVPASWRRFAIHARRLGDPEALGNAIVLSMAPSADGDVWLVG